MDKECNIVFTAQLWRQLEQHLLGTKADDRFRPKDEQLAFVLASYSSTPQQLRIIGRELLLPTGRDIEHQGPAGIAPRGHFVAQALTRCLQEGWSLIEVHSHPFDHGSHTTFSNVDWANDRKKMPTLARMLPTSPTHATMVVGQRSLDAHYYDRSTGEITPVRRITIIGADATNTGALHRSTSSGTRPTTTNRGVDERYERQVPLLGLDTQAALAESVVAVVGVGGLGCFVALQLAHLGVGTLILIDPDNVEVTNLNRLIGARPEDVGRPKVEVFGDLIARSSLNTDVVVAAAPILDPEALDIAKSADLLLGCVDSHGARLALNHLAIRYLIPLVDAGTGARVADATVSARVGGQVQLVVPGVGCLECRGFIDAQRAAFDLAPEEMRAYERAHGYGTDAPAPAVVFLNGVVASLQVAEGVRLIGNSVGAAQPIPQLVMYDALAPKVFAASSPYSGECPTCGVEGVVGLADLAPLKPAPSVGASDLRDLSVRI